MENALEKDVIVKRINGIQQEIAELKKLGECSLEEFKTGPYQSKLAQYHLHRALEGVFNISTHILSRLPGGQTTTYQEIARKMGELGIVDKVFSEQRLVLMAKYRNRLVHFYAEVTQEELYNIIHQNLDDFDIFLSAVKSVLDDPKKIGLVVS